MYTKGISVSHRDARRKITQGFWGEENRDNIEKCEQHLKFFSEKQLNGVLRIFISMILSQWQQKRR